VLGTNAARWYGRIRVPSASRSSDSCASRSASDTCARSLELRVEALHQRARAAVVDAPQARDDRLRAAPVDQRRQPFDLAPVVADRTGHRGLAGRQRDEIDAREVELPEGHERHLRPVAEQQPGTPHVSGAQREMRAQMQQSGRRRRSRRRWPPAGATR